MPGRKAQDFHGPVGSVVDTVVNISAPLTEWEKQLRFERAFKIECSKEAREWLEYLMEHRGFTCGELTRAYRYGSLRWNREEAQPEANTPLIEAIFAWGFAGFLSVLFVGWGFSLAFRSESLRSLENALLFYGSGIAYLGAIYMVTRFILQPRKVARRAMREWILDNDISVEEC